MRKVIYENPENGEIYFKVFQDLSGAPGLGMDILWDEADDGTLPSIITKENYRGCERVKGAIQINQLKLDTYNRRVAEEQARLEDEQESKDSLTQAMKNAGEVIDSASSVSELKVILKKMARAIIELRNL